MSVRHSGVSPRGRFTLAAVSMGAVAIVAFAVLFGSRIGAARATAPKHGVGQLIAASSSAISKEALNKGQAQAGSMASTSKRTRGRPIRACDIFRATGRYSMFLTDDARR